MCILHSTFKGVNIYSARLQQMASEFTFNPVGTYVGSAFYSVYQCCPLVFLIHTLVSLEKVLLGWG